MGRHRHGNGEDAVLVFEAAGKLDFLQLLAGRNVEAIRAAGFGDFLRRGLAEVNPDDFSLNLMFGQHGEPSRCEAVGLQAIRPGLRGSACISGPSRTGTAHCAAPWPRSPACWDRPARWARG